MAHRRKRTAYRPLHFNPAAKKKHLQTKQMVVTLGVPGGDVLKLEMLDSRGKRHDISDDEITTMANVPEVDELSIAIEEAYAAGVTDAIEETADDLDGDVSEVLRQAAGRRGATLRHLRRQVRRLIFHRLIRRELDHRRAHPEQDTASS